MGIFLIFGISNKRVVPRANFNTLFWALFTSYQGFVSDNWYVAMYLSLKAIGWKGALFYYSIIFVGDITLVAMFVAILLALFMEEKVTLKPIEEPKTKPEKPHANYRWRRRPTYAQRKIKPISPISNNENAINTESGMMENSGNNQSDRQKEDSKTENNIKPDETKEKQILRLNLGNNETENQSEQQIPEIKIAPSLQMRKKFEETEAAKVIENSENDMVGKLPIQRESGNLCSSKGNSRPASAVGSEQKINLNHKSNEIEEKNSDQEILNDLNSSTDSVPNEDDTILGGMWDYMKHSSLFIFHRRWAFRKWLEEWVVPFDEELFYLKSRNLEDVEIVDAYERMKSQVKARESVNMIKETEDIMRRKSRSAIFEWIVIILILASIIVLIIDDPSKDPEGALHIGSAICNYIFTCAFSLEALMKIIAMDFIFSSHKSRSAYLSNGWNILDAIVVISSIMDITSLTDAKILKTLKVLRAMRTLRLLRTMHGNEQLRVIVNSLINVVPNLAVLFILSAFYIFTFSLIGVFYFKGKLYTCNLSNVTTEEVFFKF